MCCVMMDDGVDDDEGVDDDVWMWEMLECVVCVLIEVFGLDVMYWFMELFV